MVGGVAVSACTQELHHPKRGLFLQHANNSRSTSSSSSTSSWRHKSREIVFPLPSNLKISDDADAKGTNSISMPSSTQALKLGAPKTETETEEKTTCAPQHEQRLFYSSQVTRRRALNSLLKTVSSRVHTQLLHQRRQQKQHHK